MVIMNDHQMLQRHHYNSVDIINAQNEIYLMSNEEHHAILVKEYQLQLKSDKSSRNDWQKRIIYATQIQRKEVESALTQAEQLHMKLTSNT